MTESPTGTAVLLAGYVNSDGAPGTVLMRALGRSASPFWSRDRSRLAAFLGDVAPLDRLDVLVHEPLAR